MPNRLNLPSELDVLIEKREQEDRRKEDKGVKARATDEPVQHDERKPAVDRRANGS